jgi:hypothetical protein
MQLYFFNDPNKHFLNKRSRPSDQGTLCLGKGLQNLHDDPSSSISTHCENSHFEPKPTLHLLRLQNQNRAPWHRF